MGILNLVSSTWDKHSNMNSVLILACVIGAAVARPQEIFSYDAGSHAQSASGDAGTAVEGKYSYTSPEGDEIVVTYIADEDGYRVVSDALPVAPEVPEDDPPALPVAPEIPEVKALEAPKAYTFIGPHTIPAAHAIPAPHAIPALHAIPAAYHHLGYSHPLPLNYPHFGYSHLPYHPHAFPHVLKIKEE